MTNEEAPIRGKIHVDRRSGLPDPGRTEPVGRAAWFSCSKSAPPRYPYRAQDDSRIGRGEEMLPAEILLKTYVGEQQ